MIVWIEASSISGPERSMCTKSYLQGDKHCICGIAFVHTSVRGERACEGVERV